MDGNNIKNLGELTAKKKKNKRSRKAHQNMPLEKKNELLQRKKMWQTELEAAVIGETA